MSGSRLFARLAACMARDDRGVVAVLFALMLLPLIGLVGLAIDFAVVSQAKQQLDLALDAATMQAVTAAAQATNADPQASLGPAQDSGKQRFYAQMGALPAVKLQSVAITISPPVGTTYTAVGTYSGSYTTYLGAIFGFANMAINGTATAVYQTQPYTDVEILLDNSSSMLVAAGTPAQNQLLTDKTNCLFACHTSLALLDGQDFYQIARDLRVPLRVDQLQNAISTIANSLAAANTASRYRLGVWTFADSLNVAQPLTTDITSVVSYILTVPPPIVQLLSMVPNIGNTQLSVSISQFAQNIGASGDGSSAAAPRKYVLLMTDGVQDTNTNGNILERNVDVVDQNACAAIKNTPGVTLVVLYTPFIFGTDPAFQEVQSLFTPTDTVLAALQKCASTPDLVYSASDQTQINAAAQQFIVSVLGIPARLSN